ncbi:MAG: hypothetical protein ThorAB25_15610 [Candidatus Thorarchaeota archaeon AB_25]|nr:MAG: hypothetical protein ThorAB25_15610 [Candidatus Thorarchaeota archaeon AB_25]
MSESKEKPGFWVREPLTQSLLVRRSPTIVLLIYYIWILFSAWSMSYLWGWSLEGGVMWSSGGPGTFFPFPSPPGEATVVTTASLLDQAFYLVFMHSGIWIMWILLGVLYLVSPYRIERTNFCALMKGALIAEIVLILLGATLVTNLHPRGLQFFVYGNGLLCLFTVIIWLIACRRRYAGLRVIDQ